MTHNIVAEFSFSFYTQWDYDHNRIPEGKSIGDFKQYPVISGSNFSDEYNETLNSGTILLSQVQKEDRLIQIKAYKYVRVYDTYSYDPITKKYNFDKIFLIDNFDEQENNINEHIFGYTIKLMSETKWLEKIQCPNLTITHRVREDGTTDKNTIYEHIKRYMELFVPKIKFTNDGENWSYQPLISLPPQTFITSDDIEFGASAFFVSGNDYAVSFSVNISDNVIKSSISSIVFNVTGDISLTSSSFVYNSVTEKFDFNGVIQNGYILGLDLTGLTWTLSYSFSSDSPDYIKFYNRFNVPCADLGSSAFTLRQLLTMLMQQVGCIPTVKNRVLGFLDFQLEAHPFGDGVDYTLGNTVNFISRSLSSDSFANTLVNMSSNVLDSDNEVICEVLGFRDKGNVLLRQTENLYLETRFPIYKVEKFTVNFYGWFQSNYPRLNLAIDPAVYRDDVNTTAPCIFAFSSTSAVPDGFAITTNPNTGKPRISIVIETGQSPNTKLKHAKFYPLVSDGNGGYDYIIDGWGNIMYVGEVQIVSTQIGLNNYVITYHAEFPDLDIVPDAAYMVADAELVYFASPSGTATMTFPVVNATFVINDYFLTIFKQDITPLLKENSVRAYLKTDFQEMENSNIDTIEKLAEYVYGTIGYSIGGKQISGFSQVYNIGGGTPLGWIQENKTYIENIMNFVFNNVRPTEEFIKSITDKFKVPYTINTISKLNSGERIDNITNGDIHVIYPPGELDDPHEVPSIMQNGTPFSFVELFFDIFYKPLNSFNLNFVKTQEDVDIPIAQYDSSAASLTDFDRLSIHEQEQVDRIGNETLFIRQRVGKDEYNKIQTFDNGPLYFKDDTNRDGLIDDSDNDTNYIIFKRSYTINNNHFNVSYVGSKDAILKNYFTSIRTKYRAYQYVNYGSSVLRKEKDVVFVRIGEDYYNGDDRIWLGALDAVGHNIYEGLDNFFCPINGRETSKKLQYVVSFGKDENLGDQWVKNDISLITNLRSFSIIYEDCDNVGNGTYISNANFSTIWVYDPNDDEKLGGVPQSWQIWDDSSYNKEHLVSYLYGIDFYNKDLFNDYANAQVTSTQDFMTKFNEAYITLKDAALSPIVLNSLIDIQDPTQFAITVVDKNDGESFTRTFYKDYSERVNHTVQFIYYSASKNVLFTGNLVEGNKFAAREELFINAAFNCEDNFSVQEEVYSTSETPVALNNAVEDYISVNDNAITITWNGYTHLKFCRTSSNICRDIIAFAKPENDGATSTFYLSLNDTKTDYVLSERNGILYRSHKVKANDGDNRKTED